MSVLDFGISFGVRRIALADYGSQRTNISHVQSLQGSFRIESVTERKKNQPEVESGRDDGGTRTSEGGQKKNPKVRKVKLKNLEHIASSTNRSL